MSEQRLASQRSDPLGFFTRKFSPRLTMEKTSMEKTIELVLKSFGLKLLENTEDLPPQISDLVNRRFSELL